MKAVSEDRARELIRIGFCQRSFYKPSVWKRAVDIMENILCKHKLAERFNFGRGQGKYTTDIALDDVIEQAVVIMYHEGLIAAK